MINMTEEYLFERERDFLDYIRNNLDDPSDRGTDVTNESHTMVAGQTVITLRNAFVKNVAETITVNAVTKRKGYDYYVTYGEGNSATTVTLSAAPGAGIIVTISYHFGPSMIEREFSRSDTQLPRVVMMFLTGSEEPAALGDYVEYGQGSYANMVYRFEVRSEYASQARELASKLYNLGQKMRQAGLFRTNITQSKDIQNFDYDIDKNAYIWQLSINVQWEIKFA